MASEPPSVVFRLVAPREADLPAVASLVNRAFMTHSVVRGDRTDAAGLIEEAGANGLLIIAEREGALVGSAMIRPVDEYHTVDGYAPAPGALYFGLAAVEPVLMGSGIGRLLLVDAERYACANGHSHLALNTLYEFDLVPYYVKFGCQPVFEERFAPGHWGILEPHTLCHLEKAL